MPMLCLNLRCNWRKKRVVVKRPDYAPWLGNRKPSMAMETKKNRFDVYVIAAMSGE